MCLVTKFFMTFTRTIEVINFRTPLFYLYLEFQTPLTYTHKFIFVTHDKSYTKGDPVH